MDRDLALKLATSLTNIKNSVTALATNTTPTAPDTRSLEMSRTTQEVESETPTEPEPINEKK